MCQLMCDIFNRDQILVFIALITLIDSKDHLILY